MVCLERKKLQSTFPLSLGILPLSTVGEFGTNRLYLWVHSFLQYMAKPCLEGVWSRVFDFIRMCGFWHFPHPPLAVKNQDFSSSLLTQMHRSLRKYAVPHLQRWSSAGTSPWTTNTVLIPEKIKQTSSSIVSSLPTPPLPGRPMEGRGVPSGFSEGMSPKPWNLFLNPWCNY